MFKTEPIIEDILQNFFNKNDSNEFTSLYLVGGDKREFKDKKIQDQIDYEIDGGLETKSQIDLLITFAESKLSSESFIDLLLYLGQSTITSGEFSAAIEIHEKIVSLTMDVPAMYDVQLMLTYIWVRFTAGRPGGN